jgi:HK97 family phage portal protein
VRLIDRLLSRDAGQGGSEWTLSGAFQVPTTDLRGRSAEGVPGGVVQHARRAFEDNGPVFACIAARMALFSEAEFKLQDRRDQHLMGSPDLSLLEHPWPNATSGDLWTRMEQDDSTAGNAYIRLARPSDDDSDPMLVRMRPDTVSIVSQELVDDMGRPFKIPIGYQEDLSVLGINRRPQFYDVSEVAHYAPVPDPSASWRGMSWLTPLLREVGADNALTEYKTTHVRNGAMPGIVIRYPQKLSQPSVNKLKDRFAALFGGPANAGKTLVLDEGADMTVAGSSMEQLQFAALQAGGVERVCAAAGVPLDVIGLGNRAGGEAYAQAIRRFADLWARPHWRMACASLEHLVPDLAGPSWYRLWYDVSGIAALREGELARGQTTLVKSQAVSAFVLSGYTRESAILAAESGDLTQLKPDPKAPPPGTSARQTQTQTETEQVADGPAGPGQRRPQAGVPEALPGVGHPNLPDSKPAAFSPMPALPNGARGKA